MKKVIIFGASGYGRKVLYSLDYTRFEVILFIDNNKDISGQEIAGIPIQTPDTLKNYQFDIIIISLAQYEKEMRTQLLSIGVSDNQVITYMPNTEEVIWNDQRVSMLRLCIEEIKSRNIIGNMAEVGVYKGDFSKHFNHFSPDKKLYLFDTFLGFNEKDTISIDKRMESQEKFTNTNINVVRNNMPYPDQCIIKEGYFPDTASDVEDIFCLVSLDADLYKPILSGLEYFYPRLSHGGYIFVHDYGTHSWNGVKVAVDEFCEKHQISFVPLLDRCGSVIITK